MSARPYLAVGGPCNGRVYQLDPLDHGDLVLLEEPDGLRCTYGFWTHAQSRHQPIPAVTFVSVLTSPQPAGLRR